MSKDQLGWDQLLKETADEPVAVEPEKTDEEVKKPKAKSRSKGVASSTPKATTSSAAESTSDRAPETVSYAKKNWSKLEFNKTEKAEATKVDSAKAEVPTAAVSPKPKPAPVETTISSSASLFPDEDVIVDEAVDTPVSEEPKVISVSELNRHIRETLESEFPILWLKGEISNFKAHTSGHFYFSLKDSKAQVNAVMFRGFNSQLRFRPEDGMEVIVRGKVTVYEPRGNYQIFCELMEPVGAGALQKAFEQLKSKLQKEGLFDESRKRPIPALPKHIAIVTSPTGAAIRDMLNVLGRRFKGARITLVPCKVQGDAAPKEICAAIELANRLDDVDVMIVGRGGGSIEDLWSFNEEKVARAIAASRVPVISAVGHEVDFTIADFVADLRAPTPSAAAELVVKNAADLADRVGTLAKGLRLAVLRQLNLARQLSLSMSKRLVDPQRRIQDAAMRCDELLQRMELAAQNLLKSYRSEVALLEEKLGTPLLRIAKNQDAVGAFDTRLRNGMRNLLLRKRDGLHRQMAVLDSLSPMKVLDRGYSMVVVDDRIVTDAASLKVGQKVNVRMCKGSIEAQVTKIEEKKR